jgi:hypothetical protein
MQAFEQFVGPRCVFMQLQMPEIPRSPSEINIGFGQIFACCHQCPPLSKERMRNRHRLAKRLESPQRVSPRPCRQIGLALRFQQFGAVRYNGRYPGSVSGPFILSLRPYESRGRILQLPLPMLPKPQFIPKRAPYHGIIQSLNPCPQLFQPRCRRPVRVEIFQLQQQNLIAPPFVRAPERVIDLRRGNGIAYGVGELPKLAFRISQIVQRNGFSCAVIKQACVPRCVSPFDRRRRPVLLF